jgi:hypothetical protein
VLLSSIEFYPKKGVVLGIMNTHFFISDKEMFYKLPNDVLTRIYEYDTTYREIFSDLVLLEMRWLFMKRFVVSMPKCLYSPPYLVMLR